MRALVDIMRRSAPKLKVILFFILTRLGIVRFVRVGNG
jgi:hypothetical protein